MRSRFVATAFWTPALVTGADGTAQVSFAAPDNLTAFRLMAVAADKGDRFGSGEARFTINKPLQAMPALPRFLSLGDQVAGGGDHAQQRGGGRAGRALTLSASGVELAEAGQPDGVDVPARVAAAAVFRGAGHPGRAGGVHLPGQRRRRRPTPW